jgi:hypothetical protein
VEELVMASIPQKKKEQFTVVQVVVELMMFLLVNASEWE